MLETNHEKIEEDLVDEAREICRKYLDNTGELELLDNNMLQDSLGTLKDALERAQDAYQDAQLFCDYMRDRINQHTILVKPYHWYLGKLPNGWKPQEPVTVTAQELIDLTTKGWDIMLHRKSEGDVQVLVLNDDPNRKGFKQS